MSKHGLPAESFERPRAYCPPALPHILDSLMALVSYARSAQGIGMVEGWVPAMAYVHVDRLSGRVKILDVKVSAPKPTEAKNADRNGQS